MIIREKRCKWQQRIEKILRSFSPKKKRGKKIFSFTYFLFCSCIVNACVCVHLKLIVVVVLLTATEKYEKQLQFTNIKYVN